MVGNNHGKIARIDVRKGMECLLLLIEVIVFFFQGPFSIDITGLEGQ